MNYKYLFGPVPSRRLGISLGVDLVPMKTCNLNCVYCESGVTTNLTSIRKEYVAYDDLIFEIDDFLKNNPNIDIITFSGGGEPTLNSSIGRVINYVKNKYPDYKLALITNGVLLGDSEVRDELLPLDIILPSLDSVVNEEFVMINRPDTKVNLRSTIEGMKEFRKKFKGEIWLEIFLLKTVNKNSILQLKKEILDINPDRIQLNTLDRPGTESWVKPLSIDEMKEISILMKPLPVEIIAKFNYSQCPVNKEDNLRLSDDELCDKIVNTIRRRPCTTKDIFETLQIDFVLAQKLLVNLINQKRIERYSEKRGIFYRIIAR